MGVKSHGYPPGYNKTEQGTETWANKAGRLDRLREPALIQPNGTAAWFRDGLLHRDDGPAIVRGDGTSSWYIENRPIKSAYQYQRMTGLNDQIMADLVDQYGGLE